MKKNKKIFFGNKKINNFWPLVGVIFLGLMAIFVLLGYQERADNELFEKFSGERTLSDNSVDPFVTLAEDVYKGGVRDYTPFLGNGDKLIMVFGDFVDPQTKEMWLALKKTIESDKMDKFTVAWKNFPSPVNENSFSWAEVAMCAHEQNKFWDTAEILLNGEKKYQLGDIYDLVGTLALDKKQFEQCFNERRFVDFIGQDMVDGQEFLIESVPYVLVGDERVGVEDFGNLSEIINSEVD
jgi:protein-disulfide isomerase